MSVSFALDGIIYTKYSKYSFRTGSNSDKHNAVEDENNPHKFLKIPSFIDYNGKKYPIKNIGEYSFSEIYGIEEVIIPATVEILSYGAFFKCYDLNKVEFVPGSVLNTMSTKCFDFCNLSSISIPATVTELSTDAIYNIQSLTTITYCGYSDFSNVTTYLINIQTINVHSEYPGNKFFGIEVTKSNSII